MLMAILICQYIWLGCHSEAIQSLTALYIARDHIQVLDTACEAAGEGLP